MFVFEVLYVALPAFVANMMPPVAARLGWLPVLAKPVDGGRTWRSKPLLGRNKTWRGVVFGIIGALFVVLAQHLLALPLSFDVVPLTALWSTVLYGVYVGVVVMVGDMLGSVIKRQCGKASGEPMVPLDQLDSTVLFIVATLPLISWSLLGAGIILSCAFLLTLITNRIAYDLGIKTTYW